MTDPSPRSVIAIGAIHYDTIAHAREAIRPETSTPARFTAKPGGVATNLARSLARLDVPVHLVGAVGEDGAARELSRQLTAEGLHLAVIPRAGYATGQYLALHNPSGELAAACVDDRVLSEAPADLFDEIVDGLVNELPAETLWFVDANLPEDLLTRLAGRIKPAQLYANAVSDAKAVRLRPLLSELNCLMLNRGEAAALTGLTRDTPADALAEALRNSGLRRFVLTSGRDDVLVQDKDHLTSLRPKTAAVVDVTGAGDALMAGTLAAIARGKDLTSAVPFGLAAAAMTLASTGALAPDLTWEALGSF